MRSPIGNQHIQPSTISTRSMNPHSAIRHLHFTVVSAYAFQEPGPEAQVRPAARRRKDFAPDLRGVEPRDRWKEAARACHVSSEKEEDRSQEEEENHEE